MAIESHWDDKRIEQLMFMRGIVWTYGHFFPVYRLIKIQVNTSVEYIQSIPWNVFSVHVKSRMRNCLLSENVNFQTDAVVAKKVRNIMFALSIDDIFIIWHTRWRFRSFCAFFPLFVYFKKYLHWTNWINWMKYSSLVPSSRFNRQIQMHRK